MNHSTLSNNGYKLKKQELTLSQIKDIKKEAGLYFNYEGLAVLDTNVDNTTLSIKAQIFGAKYMKLVNGIPMAEKSKHPQLSKNIRRIFNNRISTINDK